MKRTALIVALAALFGGAAQAADPTAVLDRGFSEYLGTGPLGNNDINDNDSLYWLYESTGSYGGQMVNSWLLVWDPANRNSVSGTVTFDNTVLFVHDDQAELIATSAFGKSGVTYDYSNLAVGLEKADMLNTSFAGAALTIGGTGWTAFIPGDAIRVMTAVPEPETYSLFLAGLGALAMGLRAKRRRSA